MMMTRHPGGNDIPTPTPVEIFVDPTCPFAWLAIAIERNYGADALRLKRTRTGPLVFA